MIIQKAIITSGPTREWIDPVRYISNASSGKMGFCIANEFKKIFQEVVFVHGPIDEKYIPSGVKLVPVDSTTGMLDAVTNELQSNSLLVMSAAPLDYKPKITSMEKIKKAKSGSLVLELVSNPDILMNVSEFIKNNGLQKVYKVGFAAETSNLRENSLEKLNRKGLDLIIGNIVFKNQTGFGDLDSELYLQFKNGKEQSIGPNSKEELAKTLTEIIAREIAI